MTFHNVISRQPMLLVVVVCCWLLAAPGSVVVEGFVHLPVLHSGCWDNRSRLLLAQRINENEKMNGILLDRMEEEVLASAKNQLDYNTLVKALSLRGVDQNGGDYNDSNNQKSSKLLAVLEEYGQQLPTSMWQVSFAAATVSSVLVFTLFFHNVYMAVFVFGVVFLVASQDPVNDESLLGAVARLLGRQTIQSYEASLPKLKALARAVVTGEEEIVALQSQIVNLEQENAQLRQGRHVLLPESRNLLKNSAAESNSWATSNAGRQDYHVLVNTLNQRGEESTTLLSALQEYDTEAESQTKHQQSTSNWDISLGAATVSSGLAFVLLSNNIFLALFVFVAVFVVALEDPANDDSLPGALARLLGQQTIQSYEASQPMLKALARAVVTEEEEILRLQTNVDKLEQENVFLQQARLTAEATESQYTVGYLQQVAYNNGLHDEGTKLQLLIRILENKIIPMHNLSA